LKYFDSPQKVGQRLRVARDAAGISQRDLAAQSTCTAAYISRIEKGERVPSLQLMQEFARVLGISDEFLAYGKSGRQTATRGIADARVAVRMGDLDTARELADAALSAARGDVERARASAAFGEIELAAGNHREAIDALERARLLHHAIEQEDPQVAEVLGRAYARAFEYESAIAVFERNRDGAEAAGDVLNVIRFSTLLAHAYSDSGDFKSAERSLAAAIRQSADVDDPLSRARALWGQSRLHALQNDAETAALYAERALEVLEVSDHDYHAALAHQLLAHIELDRGNAERALELLDDAGPRITATGRVFEVASFEIERARALLAVGRKEEAGSVALSAAAKMRDQSPVDAGRGYLVVAGVFRELGDDERALELYELALEHLKATPNRYLVEAYAKVAELLEETGHEGRALKLLKEAMHVQQQVDRALTPRS
jgi:tetratricopeptide (TPR) repeat protein